MYGPSNPDLICDLFGRPFPNLPPNVHAPRVDPGMDTASSSHDPHPDAQPAFGSSDRSGKAPKATLKRGDACLACRKRRIRCGAEKPACATCVRLKKECVYETVKPVSKMAKLKQRIAQLEGHIATREGTVPPDTSGSRRTSAAGTADVSMDNDSDDSDADGDAEVDTSAAASLYLDPQGQSNPTSFDGTLDPNNLAFPNFAATSNDPVVSMPPPPIPLNQQSAPMMPGDSSTAPPFGLSQPLNPHSTAPHPLQAPDPGFNYDFGILDPLMMDLAGAFLSSNMSTGFGPNDGSANIDLPTPGLFPSSASTSTGPGTGTRNTPVSLNSSDQTYQAHVAEDTGIVEIGLEADTQSGWSSEPLLTQPIGVGGDQGMVGGWFDAADVPPHVRDHLLDLYFSQGSIFNSMFDIPRFYASLTLPPSKRPHPALLYSMYLMAARRSNLPKLKALETRFSEIVEAQIDQGCKKNDRLLDICQAIVLHVNYLITMEAFNVGYYETGVAVKLAMACGLHRIRTGIWRPESGLNPLLSFVCRPGGWFLFPPKDGTELGIRIHTFWAVFQLDYSLAASYVWQPGFRIEDITTPLPRPLEEYALGMVTSKDDVTMSSVLVLPGPNPVITPSHDTFLISIIKVWAFIDKAFQLRDMAPEVPYTVQPSFDATAMGRLSLGASSPAKHNPKAFSELKACLDYYADTLPLMFQPPWRKWDEGDANLTTRQKVPDLISKLWFLIGYAYLHLHNVRSLRDKNEKAVFVARRLVGFVLGASAICEAWRGYDMFFLLVWNDIAMILLRELKRIEFFEPNKESTDYNGISEDYDLVFAAIKSWALENVKDRHVTADIAAINWRVLDSFKPMDEAQWMEAVKDADRRFV